jgi:hypothetical protein
MAGTIGFEPITTALTARDSTVELHAINGSREGNRTLGLEVMSLTSHLCSTPQ